MAKKGASEIRVNLAKFPLEVLEEMVERESNILKNKKLVAKLPDKGKQVEEKVAKIRSEIQTRKDLKELEKQLSVLNLGYDEVKPKNLDKHVQRICGLEKIPKSERYKPFINESFQEKIKDLKPTQLIPLAESIHLQITQINRVPSINLNIEGTVQKEELEACDKEGELIL